MKKGEAMNFFQQRTLGISPRSDFCFTDTSPRGAEVFSLTVGNEKTDYPSNFFEVTLKLGENYPGLLLPSFIGNTDSLLILHQETLKLFEEFDIGEYQAFPFTLLNHKDQVHSKEYVFLNPLGAKECLDLELSGADKIVLDKAKLDQAPDLFRPLEMKYEYIYSERLVKAIEEKGLTNFLFKKLTMEP